MVTAKLGRIVWHDLFTPDTEAAKEFYASIADWRFTVEHATDFAWGGGERDFILALSDDEAGAGFVGPPHGRFSGWVPYVEVADVDDAALRAQQLKGSVEKPPFEVPGVGRNCVLRDPAGALIGICLSRHTFPAPTVQFGVECYLTGSVDFPEDFYHGLFDWRLISTGGSNIERVTLSGKDIALRCSDDTHTESQASWVPSIRVNRLDSVIEKLRVSEESIVSSGGSGPNGDSSALVCDPNGALCYLID